MAVESATEIKKINKAQPMAATGNNDIVNMIDDQMEKTLRETAVDPTSTFNPWNPDDLYQKAGDYSIYEDMVQDDQISVALAIKKDLIVGSGYQFVCKDDDQSEVRTDLEMAFGEDYEGTSFEDALLEIMTSYEFGFSVTEKQFKTRKDGSLTLKKLRTRHPVSWLFHQDKHGNVIRYEQQGSTDEFSDIDPNFLIHFINNSRFDNPYGTSDLRSAYTAYFIKKQITKYYAIFMEKAASPIPVGKYDKDLAEASDVTKLFNTLKKFQASTALVIPKELEVEFLQAKGDGSVYIKGINLFNMFIGRALFVPDLLGFQGAETTGGSQALGQEQMQVFFKHIYRRRRSIERIVNKHLVEPICKWNYGELENYPKFQFKPIREDIAEKNAKLWLEAIKSPSYEVTREDINHFKKIIDFPESEIQEIENDEIDDKSAEKIVNIDNENDEANDHEKTVRKKEEYAAKTPGNYINKTDVNFIERQLNSAEDLLIKKSKPIIAEIFEAMAADLENKKATLTNIERLKIRQPILKKLARLMNKSFIELFNQAQETARNEVIRFNFTLQPAEQFLKTLQAENFAAIGDWEYKITKAARIAMIAAIKDGKPLSSVIDLLTATGAVDLATSLERYARTKFTEVMNKGRLAYFNSTGVVEAYQYSAILDGRTTPICQGLNGKIFSKNDAPTPPMHFNCRSLLIPITKFEEYNIDEKVGDQPINQFIESNIGIGFSKF